MPGIAQPLPALIGVFLAAYASAVVGFAFSALCVPILALAGLDALTMVQTLMLCSIAIYGWSPAPRFGFPFTGTAAVGRALRPAIRRMAFAEAARRVGSARLRRRIRSAFQATPNCR
jgi:hypothetical protein